MVVAVVRGGEGEPKQVGLQKCLAPLHPQQRPGEVRELSRAVTAGGGDTKRGHAVHTSPELRLSFASQRSQLKLTTAIKPPEK